MKKIIVIAAVFCFAGSVACLAQNPAGGVAAPLKIGTYNVESPSATRKNSIGYWPNRRDGVIKLIRDAGFDLLGTQETSREMLDDIVAALPQYKWIGAFRSASPSVNAILYRPDRFTLLRSGRFYYSPVPDATYSYDPDDPQRKDLNCIWAEFKDKKTGITFFHFNTHIHAFSSTPLRDTLRCRDARLLKERIASIAGDSFVLCTGDFNCMEAVHDNRTGALVSEARPGYVELVKGGILVDTRTLAEEQINGQESSHPGWVTTGASGNDLKYDHVFVSALASGEYEVLTYEVITTSAEMTHQGTVTTVNPLKDIQNGERFTANFSDHRPVTAVIRFKPRKP